VGGREPAGERGKTVAIFVVAALVIGAALAGTGGRGGLFLFFILRGAYEGLKESNQE